MGSSCQTSKKLIPHGKETQIKPKEIYLNENKHEKLPSLEIMVDEHQRTFDINTENFPQAALLSP